MSAPYWLIDTPAFTKELIEGHPSPGPLITGMNLFRAVLCKVAARASELDDPQLNILMLRLRLYEAEHADIIPLIKEQENRL